MRTARLLGFTLIELMIGLAIAALLVVLALPGYSAWIADAQIRNGAESIAGGLRYAQAEAIRQNATVEFVLNPGGWVVELIDPTTCNPVLPVAQVGTFLEGANGAVFAPFDVTGAAGGTRVTFTSLGDRRRDAAGNIRNCDASEMVAVVCVRHPMASGGACAPDAGGRVRPLNVLIFGGASGVAGQGNRSGIKICDPKWPATDPKGCPT